TGRDSYSEGFQKSVTQKYFVILACFTAVSLRKKEQKATGVKKGICLLDNNNNIDSTFKYGIPIRTTLDNSTTVQYAGLLHQLTMKARSTVRDLDPQNDLTFLRIRSKKHEIMVAPDKEYLLIVIQNPSE
uniref:Dynein light chain roadblock-type 2 n=1 Tax=Oncorhynchus kisutch TaxID=8019 RepID=A0A8C7J7T6_ONCKI